jgi:hypothetical protein
MTLLNEVTLVIFDPKRKKKKRECKHKPINIIVTLNIHPIFENGEAC